ncbi:hypothetical protein A2U01_0111753, partial [Trifolium medium]|nr:hypothetical protein [Trifolium medium]
MDTSSGCNGNESSSLDSSFSATGSCGAGTEDETATLTTLSSIASTGVAFSGATAATGVVV